MGLDDFAPAGDSASDPNEDLFDFEAQEASEPDGPRPPSSQPLREEEFDAAAESADDALESLDPPLPSQSDDSEFGQGEANSGLDMSIDLDEDLFGFPPFDGSGAGASPSSNFSSVVDDRDAHLVTEMLEDDLDEMIGDTGDEPALGAPPVEQEVVAAPAPTPRKAAEPAAPEPEPAEPFLPPEAPVANPVASTANQTMLWVLIAAAIVFMFGLLGVAWRATSSFETQIESVRSDVRSTAEELQENATENSAQLARLELELERARLAAAARNDGSTQASIFGAMESAHDRDLAVARQLLDSEHFGECRRVLFTLLAEADRMPAEHRPGVEEEARFLIARSYVSEAETLPGDPE